ncbi:MAG: hypothetical protein ACTJLK_00160, partial [Anaplasma sp.]
MFGCGIPKVSGQCVVSESSWLYLLGLVKRVFMSEGVMEKEESIVKRAAADGSGTEVGRVLDLCELKKKST